MDLQSAKYMLSMYGNVALTRNSYNRHKKEFDAFIKKYNAKIVFFKDEGDIVTISCTSYSMPEEEVEALFKGSEKEKPGIMTKEQFNKQYNEIMKMIKKRNADARKCLQK